MKKFLPVLAIVLCLLLTGCVTRKDRDRVVECLVKAGAVPSDWELVSTGSKTADAVPVIDYYYYIYNDSQDLVRLDGHWNLDEDGNKTDIRVEVCTGVEVKYDEYASGELHFTGYTGGECQVYRVVYKTYFFNMFSKLVCEEL